MKYDIKNALKCIYDLNLSKYYCKYAVNKYSWSFFTAYFNCLSFIVKKIISFKDLIN